MKMKCLLLLAALALLTAGAQAKHARPRLERIEWTWTDEPETPNPALANVLILGDSISRNYYPSVQKHLEGRANVYLFATSAADANAQIRWQIKNYFRAQGVHFDVVHFNNGMHGWAYTDSEYGKALPGLVKAIRSNAPGAKLIWASTTPLRAETAEGATNGRVDARNSMAREVMRAMNIPVDDQHSLMARHADLYMDDVHFNPAGSELQGKQAAAEILALLPKQ